MKNFMLACLLLLLTNISTAQGFEKAPTSDNGFIVALSDTSAGTSPILAKLDEFYNVVWSKKLNISTITSSVGSGVDNSYQLLESNQGGYLLYTTINVAAVSSSLIVKFDASGNVQWNLKQEFNDYAYSTSTSQINELSSGDIILFKSYYSTMFYSSISPSGNVKWSKTLAEDTAAGGKNPGFDFECMGDGSIVVCGKSDNDNCFGRLDSAGNLLWSRIYQFGTTYNQPRSITLADDGNLMVAGYGTPNFIMKVDALNGDVIWRKDITGGGTPEDIIAIGGDEYLIAASYPGKSMYKIDGNGNFESGMSFNGYAITPNYGWCSKFKKRGSDIFYTYRGLNSVSSTSYVILKADPLFNYQCAVTEFTNNLPTTFTMWNSGVLLTKNEGVYSQDTVTAVPFAITIQHENLCETTGVENLDRENAPLFYPNPVSGNNALTVEVKNSGLNKVIISDLTGKIVFSNTFNANRFEVPMNNLSKGMYTVHVTDESGNRFAKKIIKE
jgi:Secretion system C-terminal sorting domain